MKFIVTSALAGIFFLAAPAQAKFKFYGDTLKMRKEILSHIPVRSDTAEAKRILTGNHFRFRMMWDDDFISGKEEHTHIDFIYGYHDKHEIFSTLRWQVAIVHKNGKVTDVLVSFGVIQL